MGRATQNRIPRQGEWKRRFREERCDRERESTSRGAEIDAGDNLLVWEGSGCSLRQMQLIFLRVCIGLDLNLQTCPI
jgi:hypothetical protein